MFVHIFERRTTRAKNRRPGAVLLLLLLVLFCVQRLDTGTKMLWFTTDYAVGALCNITCLSFFRKQQTALLSHNYAQAQNLSQIP